MTARYTLDIFSLSKFEFLYIVLVVTLKFSTANVLERILDCITCRSQRSTRQQSSNRVTGLTILDGIGRFTGHSVQVRYILRV